MRIVGFALLVIFLGGCTSFQPVDLSSGELREQVRAGEIAQPGDRISVTTEDGKTQTIEVTEVTDNDVRSNDVNVPIDKMVSIRTKQTNRTRTTLAVAGTVAGVLIIAAAKAIGDDAADNNR